MGRRKKYVEFCVKVPCRPTLHDTRSSSSSRVEKASSRSSVDTLTSRSPGQSIERVSKSILAGLSCFATALGYSPAATGRTRRVEQSRSQQIRGLRQVDSGRGLRVLAVVGRTLFGLGDCPKKALR